MADYNENWERWVNVSVNKHFAENKGDTECFIEGFTRNTQQLEDYIEIRIDGPDVRETSRGKWKLYFEINILVVVKTTHKDVYRIKRLTGRLVPLFLDCIEVRRWGNGPEDDQTLLGCLKLIVPEQPKEKVQVAYFGKIRPDTDILQSTVEGHYVLYID
jgi:hypothetical protein